MCIVATIELKCTHMQPTLCYYLRVSVLKFNCLNYMLYINYMTYSVATFAHVKMFSFVAFF